MIPRKACPDLSRSGPCDRQSHRYSSGKCAIIVDGGARMIRHTTVGLVLAILAAGTAPAHAGDFYAGKQISFIVGAGPGGGYDLQARVAARHLGKHIPGHPAVVVQNMPARIAAANHMFITAPKDGTTI